MKLYKSPKTLFLFLVIAIFFSCKNDDSGNGNPLIGVWQRSDVSERTDFKLYFNPENKGYSTDYLTNEDSTAISSLREFIWETSENRLTLNYADGDTTTTPYSINTNGQLIVTDISDFPFNKL